MFFLVPSNLHEPYDPEAAAKAQEDFEETVVDGVVWIGDTVVSFVEGLAAGAVHVSEYGNAFLRPWSLHGLRAAAANVEDTWRLSALIADVVYKVPVLTALVGQTLVFVWPFIPSEQQERIAYELRQRSPDLARGVSATVTDKAAQIALRSILKNYLARKIAQNIAVREGSKLAVSRTAGAVLGGLGVAGTVEQAQWGSQRLRTLSPALFDLLRNHDLDLLWFVVEPTLERMVVAAMQAASDPENQKIIADEIIRLLEQTD
ncbi:MAG: hypothetical protein ACU0CO_07535 [Shimia sp.]